MSCAISGAARTVDAFLAQIMLDRRPPPVQAIQLYKQSSAVVTAQVKSWKDLKAGALTLLNTALREQNLKTVEISEIETEVYELMTR